MKKKIISIILVVCTFHACYMDVGPDDKYSTYIKGGSSSTEDDTSAAAETGEIIGEIFVKGIAGILAFSIFVVLVSAGYPTDTSADIALGFFKKVALNLNASDTDLPSIDANDPLITASYIAEGAVAILGDENIALPDNKTKDETITLIIQALYKKLASGEFTLNADNQLTFFQNITGSAVMALSESETEDVITSCSVIAKASIGSLAEASYTSSDSINIAAQSILSAITANLGDLFPDDVDQMKLAIKASTKSAINGLIDAGITDHAEINSISQSIALGSMQGLSQMDYSEDTATEISVSVSEGLAEGLLENDFSSTEIDDAGTNINQGISDGLEDLGYSSQTVESSESQVNSTIEDLKNQWGI